MAYLFYIIVAMEYICIGKIINTHGIRGELKIQSMSDFDEERYQKGNEVFIAYENEYVPFKVKSYRRHKGFPLITFENHEDINQVEKYKGSYVYIDKAKRPSLPEGQYYRDELTGLKVINEEGNDIGIVTDVEDSSGHYTNIRVSRKGMSDVLIPNIPEFVKDINLQDKIITIHAEEGLL